MCMLHKSVIGTARNEAGSNLLPCIYLKKCKYFLPFHFET